MEYANVGKSGLQVSKLSLGCWVFGSSTPQWGLPGKVGEPEAIAIIHAAMDRGINLFDTANRYTGGQSEEILGKAVKGRRHDVVIATKVHGEIRPGPNGGGQSRIHIMQEVENSLRRLGTDYIDLYQSHSVDYSTPLEETLRAYDDLIRQGKVRYIGCSNFPAWVLAKSLWVSDVKGLAAFISVQPSYSLAHRGIERELQPLCVDQGIGMILYSPTGGGILTGKYDDGVPPGSRGAERAGVVERARELRGGMTVLKDIARQLGKTPAQVSLNWAMRRPAVSSAIVGVSSIEQFYENVEAVGWVLSPEHIRQLDDAFPIA